MGSLDKHDIEYIKTKYNLDIYIETGTGSGQCLDYALQYKFDSFHSVEINLNLFSEAIYKYKTNVNCYIYKGNSFTVLPDILNCINSNVLFWLDAHFPGADFGMAEYGSTNDYNTRIPLEKELRTIKENKNISKDVFIIDDLRIYEDHQYMGGNWPSRKLLGGEGIGFIFELFEDTHNIQRDFRDQGYVIITPKET